MIPALKVYFKIAWACKTPLVFPLDLKYKPITLALLKVIASEIRKTFQYLEDVSDCDDAAWRFKAEASKRKENGVGLVVGWHRMPHCWNVALTNDGIYQVEPQNGYVFKKDKKYRALIVII
ncbi:hypothetical protein ES705_37699 [subsurface metagenome]